MAEAVKNRERRLREGYCSDLYHALEPAPQLRRRAMRDMRQSIDEYLARNPEASCLDLVKEFGTPEEAAANMLNAMDAEQIRREAKHYRWRKWVAFAAIGVAFVFAVMRCSQLIINLANQPEQYVVVGPAVEDSEPLPTSEPY